MAEELARSDLDIGELTGPPLYDTELRPHRGQLNHGSRTVDPLNADFRGG